MIFRDLAYDLIGIFFGFVIVLLTACGESQHEIGDAYYERVNSSENHDRMHLWFETNPCGILKVRAPMFNVTGKLSVPVDINTTIDIYMTHNTSFESSMYAVTHCMPVIKAELVGNDEFLIRSLPAGKYVVRVDPRAFVRGQGFPVVDRFNQSNHTLTFAFHGGDPGHSICAFSIQALA